MKIHKLLFAVSGGLLLAGYAKQETPLVVMAALVFAGAVTVFFRRRRAR